MSWKSSAPRRHRSQQSGTSDQICRSSPRGLVVIWFISHRYVIGYLLSFFTLPASQTSANVEPEVPLPPNRGVPPSETPSSSSSSPKPSEGTPPPNGVAHGSTTTPKTRSSRRRLSPHSALVVRRVNEEEEEGSRL